MEKNIKYSSLGLIAIGLVITSALLLIPSLAKQEILILNGNSNNNGIVELCRVSATSNDTSMSCSFNSKKYIHIETQIESQISSYTVGMRFNNDSNTNYATRFSLNGGTQSTQTNQNNAQLGTGIANDSPALLIIDCVNINSNRKSCSYIINKALINDTIPPIYTIGVMMWDNNNTQINQVDIIRNTGTGTLTGNSSMVIYGHD